MSRSVIITSRFPTTEEVAAELGIRGKRLKNLLALADRGLASAKKRAARKAPVQKTAAKSARSSR